MDTQSNPLAHCAHCGHESDIMQPIKTLEGYTVGYQCIDCATCEPIRCSGPGCAKSATSKDNAGHCYCPRHKAQRIAELMAIGWTVRA